MCSPFFKRQLTNDITISLTCGYMHDFIVQHRPNLMFIHFDGIDEAGHAHQWGSPDYYAAAKVYMYCYSEQLISMYAHDHAWQLQFQ